MGSYSCWFIILFNPISNAKQIIQEQLILTISGKTIDKHKCVNSDGAVYFHELAED